MSNWLDSKKRLGGYKLLGVVLLATAVGTGCEAGSAEEAPAAQASEALGTASDSAHFLGLEPLLAGLEVNPERFQREAYQCDPSPDVTEVQVCDRTVPSNMRFEWSNCTLQRPPPPEGGQVREGQPPPPSGTFTPRGAGTPCAPPVSTGSVELTQLVSNVTPDGTCGPASSYRSEQSAVFSITHALPDGGSVKFAGTTRSEGIHGASETNFNRSGMIDTTREVRDAQGQVVRSLHLSGLLTVAFDDSGEQPHRILNGTFDAASADGTTSVITVTDLRRAPPFACHSPLGGSVREVRSDGTTHELSFGPECGAATLDGQPYELRGGPHGPGGRGPGGHGPGRHGPRPGGSASAP
jgi:hypothetical protein